MKEPDWLPTITEIELEGPVVGTDGVVVDPRIILKLGTDEGEDFRVPLLPRVAADLLNLLAKELSPKGPRH